jgi:hypothetical protein
MSEGATFLHSLLHSKKCHVADLESVSTNVILQAGLAEFGGSRTTVDRVTASKVDARRLLFSMVDPAGMYILLMRKLRAEPASRRQFRVFRHRREKRLRTAVVSVLGFSTKSKLKNIRFMLEGPSLSPKHPSTCGGLKFHEEVQSQSINFMLIWCKKIVKILQI